MYVITTSGYVEYGYIMHEMLFVHDGDKRNLNLGQGHCVVKQKMLWILNILICGIYFFYFIHK